MRPIDAKTVMLDHSEAKVALYRTYLSIFLNILSNVPSVQEIFIFDLLCGEGIYENSAKGSPLIALDTIKNHYFANNETCPNITLWFNDNGLSEIEHGVYKIDRVERFSKQIFTPPNVQVQFSREDYDQIHPRALEKVRKAPKVKGLFFVDPYGYKDIKPKDIRDILKIRNTEVLLFLPASHMYRFAETSLRSSFPGSEHLQGFLMELFEDRIPRFSSVYDFIEQIRERFRIYFSHPRFFVDTFIIERGHGLVYCLFFFTGHIYGFEKMVEAKWKMDESRGQGHSRQKAIPMFSEIELSGYPQKLYDFICGKEYRTNQELYCFGLENGFLPKHTNKVLNSWEKGGVLEVFALDGKAVRGNYLLYHSDRAVGFRCLTGKADAKKVSKVNYGSQFIDRVD